MKIVLEHPHVYNVTHNQSAFIKKKLKSIIRTCTGFWQTQGFDQNNQN